MELSSADDPAALDPEPRRAGDHEWWLLPLLYGASIGGVIGCTQVALALLGLNLEAAFLAGSFAGPLIAAPIVRPLAKRAEEQRQIASFSSRRKREHDVSDHDAGHR